MSENDSAKISVFDYLEVQEYLRDALQQLNDENNNKYSYRFIAQRLGVSSKTTIGRILTGQRRSIPSDLVTGFSRLLRHDKQESDYFELLVRFCEAKNLKDQEDLYRRLIDLPRPVRKHQLRHFEYDFFKEWYISVVREVITMYKFDGDYQRLADYIRPPISIDQAKHAVHVLEELGMIEKQEDGWYVQKDVAISSRQEIRNMALLQHQLQHIDLVKKSLMLNQQENDYKISTATFGVNEEGFREVIKRVSEFQHEIVNLMARYDHCMDKVYQFNMYLYPLSRRTPGKISRK